MAETDLILAAKAAATDPVRVDGEVGPLTTNLDGRLRVASKPGYFDPITGNLTTSGNTLVANVVDASNVVLHIKNTGSAAMAAGAFVFEGSVDSTDGSDGTWFTVQAARSDSNTIETGRGTSSLAAGSGQAYAWELSVNAIRWFRIRCSTTLTASAIATWTIIRGTYATEPIPALQSHGITGTVTVAGTATTTPATTGQTTFTNISTASTNAGNIKSSAGSLLEVTLSNPTATAISFKFYNKATSPTVGTDVPILTVTVAAGGVWAAEFGSLGKRFTAGISIAMTALPASTDTGNAVAGAFAHGTYI